MSVIISSILRIGVSFVEVFEGELDVDIGIPLLYIVKATKYFYILFLVLIPLPSIIGGIGMLKQKSWAKNVILVLCIFYLFLFPVGTILSIISMVILLKKEDNGKGDGFNNGPNG